MPNSREIPLTQLLSTTEDASASSWRSHGQKSLEDHTVRLQLSTVTPPASDVNPLLDLKAYSTQRPGSGFRKRAWLRHPPRHGLFTLDKHKQQLLSLIHNEV